jgi:hypothetical protein
MPSASTISLNDGQATPVAHVFSPKVQVTPGSTILTNSDDNTTSAGDLRLHLGFSSANSKRKTNRVKYEFAYPVEATDADGITRVAYTGRFSIDVVIPEEMTQAERDDLAAYLKNAMSDSVLQGYVSDLDPMY